MQKLYVLECEGGNYYIGLTTNVIRRTTEHVNGNGSVWTKKHKPLDLIEIRSSTNEDEIVIEYMIKHGIDHVRGGCYSNIELLPQQKASLKKLIFSKTNKCFRCGRDHLVKNCYAKTDVYGEKI